MWPFSFETYQDMLKNLTFIMTGLLWVAFEASYYFIVASEHRDFLRHVIKYGEKGVQISFLTSLFVVAVVLVFFFRIQSELYDRYFVRWRADYETDFIIPELVRPFEAKLYPGFVEKAKENRDLTMRTLFFPYVQDRGDPNVVISSNQNKLARFYQQVTYYWSTQLAEIVLYVMLLATVVYFPIYRWLHLPCTRLVLTALALLLVLSINAKLARASLVPLKEITQEQITAIHQTKSADLEKGLANLSATFGMRFK